MSSEINNPTFPEMNSDPEADVSENEDVDNILNSDEDIELDDNADNDADDTDIELDDNETDNDDNNSMQTQKPTLNTEVNIIDDELSSVGELTDTDTDTDTDDDIDENAFKKLEQDIQSDFVKDNHPEVITDSHEKVEMMIHIKRNKDGEIDDPNHKTHPFMSRYEITHILGLRAKQIEHGAAPLIASPSNIIDGYQLARLELQQKKIPFIIKRPLPGNKYEYWHVRDLEILRDI